MKAIIERHRAFISGYRISFIKNMLRLAAAQNREILNDTATQALFVQLYALCFTGEPPERYREKIGELSEPIFSANVDLVVVFTRAFSEFAKEFGRHLSDQRNADISDMQDVMRHRDQWINTLTWLAKRRAQPEKPVVEQITQKRETNLESSEIIARIGDAKNLGKPVRLTSIYKGVAISYVATVLAVDLRTVTYKVHKYQAIAMDKDGHVYVSAPNMETPAIGEVMHLDRARKIALVGNYKKTDSSPEQRKQVRVQPKTLLDTTIEVDAETTLYGKLADISVKGAAVQMAQKPELEKGTNVMLRFVLVDEIRKTERKVNCKATLYTIRGDEAPFVLAFELHPERLEENIISRYLFQRQIEIVRELQSFD